MQVRDVMKSDVVVITPASSIGTALRLMQDGGFRRLPVVEEGRLVGIVTDRDLRLATNSPLVLSEKWYGDFMLEAVKVGSCMTPEPITVTAETTILQATELMRKHKIGGLPVLDPEEGVLLGIVTVSDLLDFLIDILKQEQAVA